MSLLLTLKTFTPEYTSSLGINVIKFSLNEAKDREDSFEVLIFAKKREGLLSWTLFRYYCLLQKTEGDMGKAVMGTKLDL
jgi:hypothetical protein